MTRCSNFSLLCASALFSALCSSTGLAQDTPAVPDLTLAESMQTDSVDGASAASQDNAIEEIDVNHDLSAKIEKSICTGAIPYNSLTSRAVDALFNHRPAEVIEILAPVQNKLHCIDDTSAAVKLYAILGIAYLEIDDHTESDRYFTDAILLDPYSDIESLIMLPPNAAQRLQELKLEVELRRQAHEDPSVIVRMNYVPVKFESHPFWISFVPLGAGLYQMHENEWGTTYLTTQLVGVVMAVTGAAVVESYREDNYYFSTKNVKTAKNWRIVEYTGIALLSASYLINVIHAIAIHQPVTQTILSPQNSMPETIAYTVAPVIMNDGAGVAYSTSF